jgi:hypothetical protein
MVRSVAIRRYRPTAERAVRSVAASSGSTPYIPILKVMPSWVHSYLSISVQ